MDLLSFLQGSRSRPWIGYGAAVGLPPLTVAAQSLLIEVFAGPYVPFFVVVLVVALIGTRGAAVLATAFSALLASYFSVNSKENILPQTLAGGISFATFLIISGVVIFLVYALNSTLARLSQKHNEVVALNQELTARNQELQQCVSQRTEALRCSHDQLVHEIEAKQKAEEQARQSQKMESIGLLTGGIAHDFNNMLSVIVGSLELIRRRVASGNTDITMHLDNAMDGAHRSAALTKRLLDFSRKQPLMPSMLDLNDRIGGMEDLLQRTLGSSIAVRVVKGSDLWTVQADPSQLENAILNLAINARDAMPSGGTLVIETSNAHVDNVNTDNDNVSNGKYVAISVSDTGTGMSQDIIRCASEPFFTTKPPGEGTGLGLSQIYGFIRQSGGHIEIDSTVGTGTTIKLYLPRHVATGP